MDVKKFNKDEMFYCYSINLFHYLKINGFSYLVKGVNSNTKKNYWVFERTADFLKALTVFTEGKNI